MLKIRREDLEKIYTQAAAEYPSECCGILTVGPEEGPSQVHICRNIQNELHQKNPRDYPRDASIAYFIDTRELFQVVSVAEKGGGRVSGFYHSHIDCDAYFSDEDREKAMPWGEPAYPDAVYPVLSVYDGKVKGYKCFGWDKERAVFVEVEMEVVD